VVTSSTSTATPVTLSLSKIARLDNVPNNTLIPHQLIYSSDINYWSLIGVNVIKEMVKNYPDSLRSIYINPNTNNTNINSVLYVKSDGGFKLSYSLSQDAVEAIRGFKMLFGIFVAPRNPVNVQAFISYTLPSSGCPVLYKWNGSEWVFINNLLPKGATGISKDLFLIEDNDNINGTIKLKITETGGTVTFIDSIKLYAVLHPKWSVPLIEVTKDKLILLNEKRLNDILAPSYVQDSFGNNITLLLKEPDDNGFEIAPQSWIIAEFRGVGKVVKPVLLIRSDPPIQPAYKMSLIVQVYSNGSWINVTTISPRYMFYVDAVDLSGYAEGEDDVVIRIISTAYHRIDWLALVPLGVYKTRGYSIIEVPMTNATLILRDGKSVDVYDILQESDEEYIRIEKGDELLLEFNDIDANGGLRVTYLLETTGYYKIIGDSTITVTGPLVTAVSHSYVWNLVYAVAYIPENAVSITVGLKTSEPFEGYITYAHALIEPVVVDNEAQLFGEAQTAYYLHSTATVGVYSALYKYSGFYLIALAPAYIRYGYYKYYDYWGGVETGPWDWVEEQYISVSITGTLKEQVTINRGTLYYGNDKNATDLSSDVVQWSHRLEVVSILASASSLIMDITSRVAYRGPLSAASIVLGTLGFASGAMTLMSSNPQQLSGSTAYKKVIYHKGILFEKGQRVSFALMGYIVDCQVHIDDLPVDITIQFNEDYEIIKITYTVTS
jgi:hypothetical protein